MATLHDAAATMFEAHEEYSKLLAGAHHRRETTIGAPAAIRHLAFWNPPRIGPEADDPEDEVGEAHRYGAVQRRAEAADRCISAIYRTLLLKSGEHPGVFRKLTTNCAIETNEGRLIVLFNGVIDASQGDFRPCPQGLRPDTHRAIKLSLLWHGIDTTLSFELHTEFLALTTVLDASRQKPKEEMERVISGEDAVLFDFYQALTGLGGVRNAGNAKCRDLHNRLYHMIWERVEAEIMEPLADLGYCLGKKFVDFRGVVLGANGADGRAGFSQPFMRAPIEKSTGVERPSRCNISDLDSLWRFITCAVSAETEFTLSRFLDDRAFYATGLDAQPNVFEGSSHEPLYYFLLEDTLNPGQLGRLIDRVHRAHTTRIAAMMHFDELRRASDILARTEGTLELAIWRMSQFGDDERSPELGTWLRKSLAEVEAELSKAAALKLDGTLDSRIERSRHYVNQFFRLVPALRIGRVVGFEPYDEFVTQRMGPAFEYIDGIGRIYARVQNDQASLQRRIALDDGGRMSDAQQIVSEAQQIADIALSCALGPYYVGYLFAHALGGLVQERTVWLIATVFGIAMFGLIKMRGEPAISKPRKLRFVRDLLARRSARFALALLIAIPAGAALSELLPAPPPTEGHGATAAAAPVAPRPQPH